MIYIIYILCIAFKEAHGGGGITGFIQLLSTALFILEGSPKPAFYDALLPKIGQPLHYANEGGWRKVEADGINELQPEIFLSQIKYQVEDGKDIEFEQEIKNKEINLQGNNDFIGFFLQRRDATKADDGYNYIVSIIWKNQQAYLDWKAINLSILSDKLNVRKSNFSFYEGKLTLSSTSGI